MPKLICKKDQVQLVIHKTGAVVIDMFDNPPRPYQIWSCDEWQCPKCGDIVMAGFGDNPIAEHFQEDFKEVLRKVEDQGVLNYGS